MDAQAAIGQRLAAVVQLLVRIDALEARVGTNCGIGKFRRKVCDLCYPLTSRRLSVPFRGLY